MDYYSSSPFVKVLLNMDIAYVGQCPLFLGKTRIT